MIFQRVNFGFGLLANALTTTDTTLTMQTGHYLPIESGPMRLVLWNAILYPVPVSDPNFEVVTAYYSGTPNVYTIIRGQEDTFAHAHAIGDKVAMTYTKGVSASDLYVLGSKEINEDNIGDGRAVVYNALLDRLEYGTGGGGGITIPATKTYWVDKNRVDAYTPDGSIASPFRTIGSAIEKIIANEDNGVSSYLIEIAPAVYHEQIVLESLALYNIHFHGNGEVIIQPFPGGGGSSGVPTSSGSVPSSSDYIPSSSEYIPSSSEFVPSSSDIPSSSGGGTGTAYAIRSLQYNNNLLTLRFDNLQFMAPIKLKGYCGTNAFSDVRFDNCDFYEDTDTIYEGGTIEAKYLNNLTFHNCRSTQDIAFTNVWWSYFNSCHLEGAFSFTMDDTCAPGAGVDNMALFNGTYLQGPVTFLREEASETLVTFTLVANGSRIGRGNPVTVPPLVTIYAQNSFLRGIWKNNGLAILSNSFVQGFSQAGTGILQITDQPASQIHNDSDVSGFSVKDALNNLQAGTGVVDHAKLQNLDYAHAKHTGFQKELIWDDDLVAYLIDRNN